MIMEKNYKKEYYYDNNTVLTAVDNGHAVLVIYIENLNNKSDGYCVPIAYLSNNCGLFFMDKDCYIVNKYISWCECMKYEITIDSHLLYMHWPREISKIGWDVYGVREESFKEKAAKLISEAKDIIEKARHEKGIINIYVGM